MVCDLRISFLVPPLNVGRCLISNLPSTQEFARNRVWLHRHFQIRQNKISSRSSVQFLFNCCNQSLGSCELMDVTSTESELRVLMLASSDGDAAAYRTLLERLGS